MARSWLHLGRRDHHTGDRHGPAEPDGASLTPSDVQLVYEAVLGRRAGPEEVAHQIAHGGDLRSLLAAVAGSDERRDRGSASGVAAPDSESAEPEPPRTRLVAPVVNVHTDDLAGFGIAAGTWSDDEAAVVGHDGWLFLGRGNNLVLSQYRGEIDLPDRWMEQWVEAVELRRAGARALGATFAGIVVPDKLSVLVDHFPEPLPNAADPPAVRLTSRPDLGLAYPVEELRAVPGGAYLRTDTHLGYAGNLALARALGAQLGVEIPDLLEPAAAPRHVISGDLGSRFDPRVVEVVRTVGDMGIATIVDSNHAEIAAVGGHIGTRQVLRAPSAPDDRTVVIFGDSYAWCAPTYQGLAWFLGQVFHEVHLVWIPFGWDPDYAAAVGADVVVCECAERFVIRPPMPRVDALALAAQTLERRRGITPEELDA